MKLLRVFLAVVIVSSIAISCKKSTADAQKDLDKAIEKAGDDVGKSIDKGVDNVANATEEAIEETSKTVADAAENVQDAVNEVVKSAGIKAHYPKDADLQNAVNNSMVVMSRENPGVGKKFTSAYGYVIFPKITKGGLGIGGAGGKGLVFEQNTVIGSATLVQATIGLQAGGQQYAEYIIFENKAALDRFTNNKFKFAGEASAVAIDNAASNNIDYQDGVAVYTDSNKGLMAEAAIGTQKFKYKAGIK